MTRPVILFPDPVVETLAALRGPLLADPRLVADDRPLPSVSRRMPTRDVYTAQTAILVVDDGDAGEGSRVHETATIRITVWDTDAHRAMEVARLARAHLLAYTGPSVSYGGGTRPFSTTDPDDETPLASFTITARIKGK